MCERIIEQHLGCIKLVKGAKLLVLFLNKIKRKRKFNSMNRIACYRMMLYLNYFIRRVLLSRKCNDLNPVYWQIE